ncbi:MAG: hypothetical protein RL065_1859 [Bacteroidota bacterium]|jgi:peroxiredoxin-like protein
MAIEHLYDVKVSWLSDRKGSMSSSELTQAIEVATPPEFPKGIPNVWSPEHLLIAAANSCLMTTFLAIAGNFKLNFVSFESNGIGKLEMVENKYMISEITLKPTLVIDISTEKEKAEKVLQKAEAACLISNSIKSKIIFEPIVICNQN